MNVQLWIIASVILPFFWRSKHKGKREKSRMLSGTLLKVRIKETCLFPWRLPAPWTFVPGTVNNSALPFHKYGNRQRTVFKQSSKAHRQKGKCVFHLFLKCLISVMPNKWARSLKNYSGRLPTVSTWKLCLIVLWTEDSSYIHAGVVGKSFAIIIV